MRDAVASGVGSSAGCGGPLSNVSCLVDATHSAGHHVLGLLDSLPVDIMFSHIWSQLPRRDRKRLRQSGRKVAQHCSSELMRHLKVLMCRASLLQLTTTCRTLHQLFPRPSSLELRLLPPAQRRDGEAAAAAGSGLGSGGADVGPTTAADGGWHGSTAVMSYFLSELGMTTSVTSLSLQGWQELSARDLHHVAASYPRLTRLHLGGLPYNNYLAGSSLESLAAAASPRTSAPPPPAPPRTGAVPPTPRQTQMPDTRHHDHRHQQLQPHLQHQSNSSHSPAAAEPPAPPPPAEPAVAVAADELRELVVDTQLLLEPAAALACLSRLPRLSSLDLVGVPLLPSMDLPLEALSALSALTRLALTFEHKHARSEQQLAGLGRLRGLRHLGLDFMQLGTGSSLWSAGWLLIRVTTALTALTALHLPRAFLYDKTHPDFLRALATLPYLSDLALGSIILSPETAAAATPSPATEGDDGASGGGLAAASLVRPWRRLALGAAMPCYLEVLLPAMLGGQECNRFSVAAAAVTATDWGDKGGAGAAGGAGAGDGGSAAAPSASPGKGGGDGRGRDGGGGGGLDLLELSTPCTLQMIQLLPYFVRQHGGPAAEAAASAAGPAGSGSFGEGGGGGVREVRLMLRLAANWREVVAAAAAVGPALTSLALLPTYLYGSGTMMGPQVVSCVASSLPLLEHLELHRLNTDPQDIVCLANMRRLRFVLLGVAEEARERRGAGHPASLVLELLGALHATRSRRSKCGCCCSSDSCRSGDRSIRPASSSSAVAGGDGNDEYRGTGASTNGYHLALNGNGSGYGDGGGSGSVVICCPELSEEDAARLEEVCELEYGAYDMYGSRLHVERSVDESLPWRLAVGSSMGPGRWQP